MLFVTSLLFINIFALVIALFIIVLDTVISNYGIVTITINDGKEFKAPGGKSLLKTLFENKYFIPSACGGKGTCGYCKVIVKEGGGSALPTETLILSPREIRQYYRLSCQLKVRNDLKIEIAPEYLAIKEYEGEIVYSELVTGDIRKIRITLIEPKEIQYKPGQYVQIKVDTPGGVEYRAYSMASHPDDKSTIELNVKLIPEGIGSSYLHSLRTGDHCRFSGPYGDFYLRTDSSRKIVCVVGGVGLAPIKSIISYWDTHAKERLVEFYYGSRTIKDLYDHTDFKEIARRNTRFAYYPALSDDRGGWKGETGFIHTVIDKYLKDGNNAEAYMCGPPIMIEAATEVLENKGVPAERIWYDKF